MHPSDPLYAQQWHFGLLGNIEKIWDEFSGGGIHVGVYDSGIELTHPDLAGNYDPTRRVIINGTPLDGEPNATTPDPHGTAVVGLIGAGANNGQGGVGVAWGSTFTSIDFLDPSSPAYDSYSPFHQLVNFDVANHSWNALVANAYTPFSNLYGGGAYATTNVEYDYASANGRGGLGTILVQGVGNSNIDAQYSGLSASRFTISVGGTQEDGFAFSFSNYGACLLVTAPAVNIVATDLTGSAGFVPDDYVDAADNAATPPNGLNGTSLSGPIVSGVVALVLDANPSLGWRDVQNIIAASATHTGSAIGAVTPGTNENSNWFLNDAANWNGGGMHFSNDYGYGLLNAYNAVRMAEAWSLFTPAQTSANEYSWHTEDDTDRAIPDEGVLPFSVSLLPSPAIDVEHVELRIELTHADYTQLRIFLVSPSGTETQLFDGSGGTDLTADTLLNWTYGAEALRGEDVSGNWTVRIEDAAAGETGTLSWFNLVAYGAATSVNEVYHYTDEFLAMKALAGEASRATLTDANGGTDWIDAAAVTGNMILNLTAGLTSTVNAVPWFTIAAATVIENAVTGDGTDIITGNSAANVLYGMRGSDTLNGGGGVDTAGFAGPRKDYLVHSTFVGGVLQTIVTDSNSSRDGVDTLTGIEKLAFSDGTSTIVGAQQNNTTNVDGDRFNDVLFQNNTSGQIFYEKMVDGHAASGNYLTNPLGTLRAAGSGHIDPAVGTAADVLVQDVASGTGVFGVGPGGIYYYSPQDAQPWHVVAWSLEDDTSADPSVRTTSWTLGAVADVNGDGTADAVIQSTNKGAIYYMPMVNGVPGAWGVASYDLRLADTPGSDYLRFAGAGDVNADGFADVVVRNASDGTVYWGDMAGGAFTPPWHQMGAGPLGADYKVVGVGDVNGDGHADVIVQLQLQGPSGLNGWTLWGDATESDPANTWKQVTNDAALRTGDNHTALLARSVVDLNNDGYADVVFQNSTTGDTKYWDMNPTTGGHFTDIGTVPGWHVI